MHEKFQLMRHSVRKFQIIVISLVALAALVYFGLPNFVWPPGGSSGGKQTKCNANVRGLAGGLKDYAEGNGGARPESLEALVQWHRDFGGSVPCCPFHDGGGHPYVYFAPDTLAVDQNGKQVLLYCRAPHPETVYSADGDSGTGTVPVMRPDLTVDFIPINEIKVTIENE